MITAKNLLSAEDSLNDLKNTTEKLLYMLEEIQTSCNNFSHIHKPLPHHTLTQSKLSKLNKNTENDCSIYKRLTRQCNCMNQLDYNDFVIHFNVTKYVTSINGEIIKNLKVVKRFLYMGGDYTRRALMFLNEGLSDSKPKEITDITHGCVHADICNVFEHHSIVAVCILCPSKYSICEDGFTQALAASLLFKLAQSEEGQQYLKFSYTITHELIEVLRTKRHENGNTMLEYDTLESLNGTLSKMHPSLKRDLNGNFYIDKFIDEETFIIRNERSKNSEHPVECTIQPYYRASIHQNLTLKRPRIVPIYTD